MITPDPVELAEWQLARDRKATARFTGMFQRRRAKMAVSPLSYLRGGAATFYRLLADFPELREGPPGEGWICGDAHLENFGVYRTDEKRDDQRAIVFDLNDFDEAAMGPFRYDVLRLVTSLILGGRELGASGTRSLGLFSQLLAAYAGAVCEEIPLPEVPPPIARLLGKVEQRSGRDILDQRTEVANGLRRFVLDERYTALPAGIAAAAPIAFEAYASALGGTWFDAVDVAFRIAGTGGLGTLRVAVLARDRDNPEKYRLFDMKESLAPCAAMVLKPPDLPQNLRVVTAMKACLPKLPRMLGLTELDGCPMLVRRLAPQEDKLNLTRLQPADLDPLAVYLGGLLGRAHRRGATVPVTAPWSFRERERLIEKAIVLTGIHEGAYLAWCRSGVA